MPPPIRRAPLRSLTPQARRSPAIIVRPFSTTLARHEVEIPPESPNFIPLPEMPQSYEEKRRRVKGILPVPRNIFHKRAKGPHKIQTPRFVQKTAPKSRAELAGLPPKSDADAWKRIMAESRRKALSEGLTSLWQRQQTREKRAKDRADTKKFRHIEDARAPERLDEVYTRGTVTQATLNTAVVRDPEYETRQRESAERTAALQKMSSDARKDSLQRLYVEAGDFIVTEEELVNKVNTIFSEDYFNKMGMKKGSFWGAENIWEAQGAPIKVTSMHIRMKGRVSAMMDAYRSADSKTIQRQKIIAGELAGGALSVSNSNINQE